MANLTKRVLDAAKPAPSDYFLWCAATPGFGARVHPSGRKIFVAQLRFQGRTVRMKLGPYGPFTVEGARSLAEAAIRSASEGKDPRFAKQDAKAALTVSEVCDRYLEAARAGLVMTRFRRPQQPSTVAIDEGRVLRHIKPLVGKISARELRRADIQRMADDIAKGKTAGVFKSRARGKAVVSGGTGTAARVVELLGGVFAWAEKRGFVDGPSPIRGVETARAQAKDRVLNDDELRALGEVLDAEAARLPAATAALRLIALTGLRREEACALRWDEVDQAGSCLRLAKTKTGRSTRPIGRSAMALIASVLRSSDEWVFPNSRNSGSATLKRSIADLFDRAGLTDARAHDLRRTFGSIAADEGYSDSTIGELLGHARRGVTSKHYIRRPDDALIAAASKVLDRIASKMSGAAKPADMPVPNEVAAR